MCSISAAFSKEKLIELVELNRYRGEYSHSITNYNPNSRTITSLVRGFGPIKSDSIFIHPDNYCIIHQQAPTTDTSEDTVHPAMVDGDLLWHNGILKPRTIKRLQTEYNSKSTWDTYLLLKHLTKTHNAENIDGSFSCLYYRWGSLYVFRNEIAPLFVDEAFNISSTKFKDSTPIDPNKIWLFELGLNMLVDIKKHFSTIDNPYFMGNK